MVPAIRLGRNSNDNGVSQRLTFFGMVGVVMAALHLKNRWDDQYQQLPSDEEGGVALPTSPLPREADDISMLDTQIPGAGRPKRPKRRGCCMCCGIDCTLFWKAFGIVLLGFTLWNGFKLIQWAMKPKVTGLEGMPEYSTSLGCASAPYIYNGEPTKYNVPVDGMVSHHLDVLGAAVGTVVIAAAPADATDITLEFGVRTDDKLLLEQIKTKFTNRPTFSSSIFTTPVAVGANSCMRYDIIIYVPSTLKELKVSAHAVAHIKFHPDAEIQLDSLKVNMFTLDDRNLLIPSTSLLATSLELDSYKGWIVGDVSIVNSTTISTKRGSCVTNLHVHPTPLEKLPFSGPAYLSSINGIGRTDFFYESDSAYPHRPISSSHFSARSGDLYLTYKDAGYSGRVDINAKSRTVFNMEGSIGSPGHDINEKPWVGSPNGEDTLYISSPRGWVGLYF